jgi:LysR family positive regulator for ilvC
MSPSTLSRKIQGLESEFSQSFFERDNRSVRLTAAGKRFTEFAESVLSQWKHLKDEFDVSSQALSGDLAIYSTVTAAHLYLPELIERFRENYPHVDIKLETGDVAFATNKVVKREVDFAFAVAEDKWDDKFIFHHLNYAPFKFIAPKQRTIFSKYLSGDQILWQELPFVMPESGPAQRRLQDWFKQMKIKPKIYTHVSGHEAIVSMTALGCGVSAVPAPVLETSPVRDKVKVLSVPLTPKPFDLGIIGLKKALSSPINRAFWNTTLEIPAE